MQPSFDYAAVKFLMLWERVEKPLHESLNTGADAKAVRRALKHFQVSRTFSGVKDDSRALRIAELLAEAAMLDAPPESRVEHLADQFRTEFGTRNLSAASKLLWLRFRKPYIILDSRALNAVFAQARPTATVTYAAYVEAWQEQYEQARPQVREACLRLIDAKQQIARWRSDILSLESLTTEQWFSERVFDIYLWEFGTGDG